jgi:electron transport complex protein RnfC
MPRSFFGGVHPKGHKELSRDAALTVFQPKLVSIAMSQHIGAPCKPLVAVGQRVTVGQKVGDGTGLCAPVHASISGTVVAVEERPHPGGTQVLSVVIENDGRDDLSPDIHPRESIGELDAQALIDILREAGITGMGGAGFPTYFKLSSGLGKVDTVIVNGAECEPYITADDRLMRQTPERVMGGLRIIRKILQPERTAIGIEANKPEAIEAMRAVLEEGVELLPLRVRYPQGAEKQLIQSVTGRCVPPGGLPASVGCAVFNAATCAAIYDAVYAGMPLVRRAVTVTGGAIAHPGNFIAPIGTPFSELIEAAGGFACTPYKILCGGPMMGLAQYTIDAMTIKGCNAITCLSEKDRRGQAAQHCIRCGKCVENCPMHLMPLFMHKASAAGKLERLKELHVADCIECGCCAYGCPAGIPLVQSFRTAKRMLRDAAAREKEAAK